ncbi:hypothetical protein CC86DRAFT_411103 [Ophiobolus disseminans]|uniref:Extracellular membrane protein CFEM domain-containing protein n=1 Tax=Ophiobolus disseminans TaxID=1469910 RepID=A0A6A6ZKX2_9PLEO|nr:hypothetical protein CC86DRAFT_411103 [Ophiobolus disseminans]
MRIAIIVGALAALVFAVPYPQELPDEDEATASISAPFATPTVPAVLTTSLNIPLTTLIPDPDTPTSSKKNPHWEPIPIFTKECKCDVATVRYPCWATDALQKCNYEENFSYGCYMAAAGGCPTPTRTCKDLYQPTPRSGRHPCELGQNPPLITSVPELPSSVPVVPTLNVSLPGLPSANVTLPVTLPSANITLPVTLPVQSG